jgi:hypothetical protein
VIPFIGYRRLVSDVGAMKFAQSFYEAFFDMPYVDLAVWKARKKIAAADPDDLTWLTPILVNQGG